MADWTVNSSGQLVWGGSGPAPYLSPDLQQQLISSGGGSTPAGAQYGVYSPYPGAAPIPLPGTSPTTSPTLDLGGGSSSYQPGPITNVVNDLLTASISGGSGPGGQLNSLAMGNILPSNVSSGLQGLATGQLPPALANQISAQLNESFGAVGNRFGTDLANATAQGMGTAGAQQMLAAINEMLQTKNTELSAISDLLNFGSTMSGQELQGELGTSTALMNLLNLLLGSGAVPGA